MAFTFRGFANASATGATEVDCNRAAGAQVGDLLILVVAFEAVAAGSGPWIIPNTGQFSSNYIGPTQSWEQVCWQAPSATGVGIEVWAAIFNSGTLNYAMFAAPQNAVAVTCAWGGEYNPTGSIVSAPPRVAVTAQVVGNAPPAPSVNANLGELIIACAGDLTAAGFGTPSGFTNRVDQARVGFGNVEATIADRTATVAGVTGPITFPNNTAAANTAGSTATLCIVPVPAVAGVGAVQNAGLPDHLDIGPNYTLRITAVDPASGNQVTGVNVTQAVITGTQLGTVPTGGQTAGNWQLVPGPGA